MFKAHLRKSIRGHRRDLDPITRQNLNRHINAAVLKLVEESGFTRLAAFWPFDGEPDLRPVLNQLCDQNIFIALPVVDKDQSEPALLFRAWTSEAELKKNRFGIEEPFAGEIVSINQLELLLIPLLAWDAHGNRLGMGAGYYDRAMSGMKGKTEPLRAGVAYELQKSAKIPTDPWDIDLHLVITEKGRFTCSP